MPQRSAGIDGSFNEARWFYAPTGRKVIAQGKAKRRPGIRYATIFASPERAEPAVRKSMRTCFALSGLWRIGAAAYLGRSLTTQGGASLYPGLSHYAPLGRTIRLRIGVDCTLQAIQVMVGYSRLKKLGHCPRVFLFDQAFQQAFHQASMEPRLRSRGKEMPDVIWMQESKKRSPNTPPSGTTVSLARIMAGFNWAATWKSRKGVRCSRTARRINGFNGAATWKSRKDPTLERQCFLLCASMGPRLGSRGKIVSDIELIEADLSFNGAATWKSRKDGGANRIGSGG